MSDGAEVRIDGVLEEVRASLPPRPTVADLPVLVAGGALIVDIRPIAQRESDGALPGAIVIDRNVLEWRLDPTSPNRLPIAVDADRAIVVVCNEGYASSLAAASLQQLGLRGATDLDGGFQALLASGSLPSVEGASPTDLAEALAGAGTSLPPRGPAPALLSGGGGTGPGCSR